MPSKRKVGSFEAVEWLIGAGSAKDVMIIAVNGEIEAV